MSILAGVIVAIGALLGIVLTLLTLPGTWFAVLVAVGCELWRPELFSWWTLGAAIGVAAVAEVLEIFASAAGAGRAGGSKAAAIAAVIGSIVGAIVGSALLLFPIGTIAGAIIGAGLAAGLVERGKSGKSWRDSARVGTGAATGRFAATVVKVSLACVIAAILIVAAFVP